MLIKFRAECRRDVNKFLELLPSHCLIWYKVIPQEIKGVRVPDVDCEMDVKNITIPDLIDLMSHISDTHVMQETIALAENYTGIRDYQGFDENHRERHLLLHRLLDELTADYIGHTKKLLKDTSVIELLKWSYAQTLEPEEIE